jgi:DNA-binding transcriptional regulator YdaS (Cro superfamily)
MYFETLQARLLDYVRWKVRNGELTERRLAGLIGVSQPHMHNVLKGLRTLSPGIADRILRMLEMSVLDLAVPERSARDEMRQTR